VQEESHLDEMRDAVRGDFERLAERRGEQGLLHVTESAPDSAEEAPRAEQERRFWLARLFSH
jgi:hypothetical protein